MEEAAWLVGRSVSEGSARPGFGTMTYTEDRLAGTEGAGEPGSASASGPPDNPPDNESGELLDGGDASALEQFHEQALRQAGCGLSQVRVVVACGLAVAGASLELSAIPFILPSAEIELCILPHEKNWLVLISLVGGALGGAFWGSLGGRLGARRALLSALAVNAVFAAVAAFMPTYGTFMMARFSSALGSGGVVPSSYTYVGAMSPRGSRGRALAALPAAAGAGCLAAAALARAALPLTGASTLTQNNDHFSAWHRYLLLCTLPILASLVSLIWTQESPRFLLEVGREVDAMTVYQNIHSGNQIRFCGKANVAAANSRAPTYHLGELSLPGKRRPPVRCNSVEMFWVTIFQLFSTTYRRTTLCLGGILLFTTALQFYLSSYVPSTVINTSSDLFEASKIIIENTTYHNEHYNRTLENVHYSNVSFTNCTFRDMLLSHVAFRNCSFYDVAFLNIKTSYTFFGGCLFVNSTIIDTDMELGRELDEWCVFNSTVLRGMQRGCSRHADLTSRLHPLAAEQSYVAHAMLAAAVLALLPQKLRPMVALCGVCVLLSPSIYLAKSETALYIVEAVYRVFLTLIYFTVGYEVVEHYPANVRTTAHGLMLSISYAGGALVRGLGNGGTIVSTVTCAALAAAATGLAVRAR
ncbi:synaptic vesicle glycoprotein 2A-like [Pectinophora gossypiella]|nr:synaptic vesicle glycoprotein 2A-like [Pectinophora gossypiella]XP_049882652.1 synaptic vesicle glycoprotein 2A-like [Pectinophora gossypiella]XP_049882653.1 synaptic vesicle glycoprotein 2A-like [Pectinophora gossypiella]